MDENDAQRARQRLVDYLHREGILYSTKVIKAMETVPRHEFVPEAVRSQAYQDEPLSIGQAQVITAPHLVARMTELLDLHPGMTVLEIGTGSGYHAAVIAEIVGAEHVYTVERLPELARSAREALDRTGYGAVTVVVGDGSRGLPCHPPFDRINVTAVAETIPEPLLEQLAGDGQMVIPLGPREGSHDLVLVTKHQGRVDRVNYGPVRFVPLIGEYGFDGEE